jgi:uncharacterized membrane protein
MLSLASSFQQPDTVSFYNIVVFVHISAAIIAFGVTFAYPIVDAILHRPGNLKHLGWWHRVQAEVGQKLITISATVLLIAGIYLAADGPYDFGSTFVSIGIVIIVVLLGLGGAFFSPTERRAAELAERDIAAAGADQEVRLSDEYQAVAQRLKVAGIASSLLILVAVFLMVNKPL